MKSRLPLLAVVCGLLFFFSCSKRLTSFDFLDRNKLDVQEIRFDYFSTKTKINFSDGDTKINATAQIRIKLDSIIWFSLQPALGIEAARGVITQDSLIVVDRINKVYYVYDYKLLSEKYNFEINYNLLQAIVLGNPPHNLSESEKVVRETDYVMVEQREGTATFTNYISLATSKLEKLKIVDTPTSNSLDLVYSAFQLVDEFHIFPFKTVLSLKYNKPGEQLPYMTQIDIEHNKADVEDGKRLKFPFNVPQKYERK